MSLASRHLTMLAAALLFPACDPAGPVEPPAPAAAVVPHAAHEPAADRLGPGALRWIAGVRAATARFHDFEAAKAAGYDTKITGCMEAPGVGGMGEHWGDTDLIDGAVEAFAPELLLYEPQMDGRMRLVAVEYIVPFSAWPKTDPAPVLYGQAFGQNDTFQVWALHVWTFAPNPSGILAGYNPTISCAYAAAE